MGLEGVPGGSDAEVKVEKRGVSLFSRGSQQLGWAPHTHSVTEWTESDEGRGQACSWGGDLAPSCAL